MHVEAAINRTINYRILIEIILLAITMMQHIDEIVLVHAALCNTKMN